ncbi:hypothetical protein KC353_g5823, partial [Hortaea werneckii]
VHGPPDEEPIHDPTHYELVIDNDSGTYRPNPALLPILKDFLSRSLPGLHIQILDCQADAEKMAQMKQEQRELKKREGDHIVFTQGSASRSSSISSSDEESLDRIQAAVGECGGDDQGRRRRDQNPYVQAAKDSKAKQAARVAKAKRTYGGKARPGADREEVEVEASTSA